jgi:hypothetical protein
MDRANEIDRRILAAVASAQQPTQQWNPVLGFLLPLYGQLLTADVRQRGGIHPDGAAMAYAANLAWLQALAAFREIGFECVHPLGCKMIDNESANERALNAGLDEAGKDAR